MKKIILIASLFAFAKFGFAQTNGDVTSPSDSIVTTEVVNPSKYTVETNTFGHNWFVGLGIGGQIYFGDHTEQMEFLDRPSLYGDANFGKWFTPGLGIRMSVSGGVSKAVSGWTAHVGTPELYGANRNNYKGFIVYDKTGKPEVYKNGPKNHYDLFNTREQWMNVGFEALFNISNMVLGYKEDRVYSFIPYGGVGFAFSLNPAVDYVDFVKSPNKDYSHVVSASFGLLNRFHLSDHWDLNIDLKTIYVGETFDQQFGGLKNGYHNGLAGGSWGEGILTANIGLAYNFNPGWQKATRTTIRVNENVLLDLRNRLSDVESRNLILRQQLEDALNREVTESNVIAQPLLVTFTIDRWKLSKKDRVNLGFLAKAIKENPNVVYTVTGYADKGTGSVKRNIFLAQKRAEVVYNCLVNEFGVSESQLRKGSEGGVGNMYYNDPRLSRAVLTKVVSE